MDDDIKKSLETFSPLSQVFLSASKVADLESQIRYAQEDGLDRPDTSLLESYRVSAFEAMLAYKQAIESGAVAPNPCSSLLDLSRVTGRGDSTASILPVTGPSTLLTHGKFFFFGGRPFIDKLTPEDNTIYTDAQGKPETRFVSQITENANYLITSLFNYKHPQATVTFAAPPFNAYSPMNIKGVRSLIHTFKERIPVLFLTDDGLVPASLTTWQVKVAPENQGCVSDQPWVEFACSENLEADNILAVYIPYDDASVTSCKVSHPDNKLWTADLNNDGIADIACVAGFFVGAVSDAMAEAIWFVNINGRWQIIDAGQQLDCT